MDDSTNQVKNLNVSFFLFQDNFSIGVKNAYTLIRDNETGAVFVITEFLFQEDSGKCEVSYKRANTIAEGLNDEKVDTIMARLANALLANAVEMANSLQEKLMSETEEEYNEEEE